MKHLTAFLLSTLLLAACKSDKNAEPQSDGTRQEVNTREVKTDPLPEALTEILNAHGGLDQWNKQRTLSYKLPKGDITETHTIDLWNRWDRIEAGQYSMGYDGKGTWLQNPEAAYEGNPEFYHNLFFYFYAMPFVLADPGIVYSEAPDLEFDGKTYPGIRIAYENEVGTSPEDEYYLHYDPASGQMAWLGYTVTYGTGASSDDIHWIRYDDWDYLNDLLLPQSISWYNYEGRNIKDLRNTMEFKDIRISEEATDRGFFAKPDTLTYFQARP